MSVRNEVPKHIVDVIRGAEDSGLDGLAAASSAFPGTPASVLGEALWLAEERRAADWWSGVERTIDGEIIKLALLKNGGAR